MAKASKNSDPESPRSSSPEKTDSLSKILTPTELKAEAAKLIDSGDMPSLDEFLDAVASTRKKFAPKIRAARK